MTPEQLARNVSELVSLPRAYYRVSEMLEDPHCSSADIGKVIAHDPALTARLLRVVNSAYYSLPSKVDTIPQAITVLGTRALHELILATSVTSAFAKISTDLVDMADFWHHSIYCGILARALSRRLRRGQPEQVFVAGLLHDIGKLVMYHKLPEHAAEVLRLFAESDEPLYRVERDVLGFDHAAVGSALLSAWKLPESLRAPVALHHTPVRATTFADEVTLVHVANALSKKVEPGYKVRRRNSDQAAIDPAASQRMPLDPALLDQLRLEADVQSIEVFSTLFSGTALAR
jgi:putative nucleotidyltransferase with HDIG domain